MLHSPRTLKKFKQTVWSYYQTHKRNLPWRKNINPYRVLVSEIMLQQTQADRVIPKYQSLLRRFGTLRALRNAPLRDVLEEWSGLGYNRRAKYLKQLADAVARIPRTTEELCALPGIGRATAAAICVYAHNLPCPFIETNVRTVFIHHFFNGASAVADEDLLPLVQKTIDLKNPREWFWALMDYGVYLKKLHKNPSRRSKHYTKQSKFEGSVRQLRGRIVKLFLEKHSVSTASIAKMLGTPKQKVAPVVAQLKKEGFFD